MDERSAYVDVTNGCRLWTATSGSGPAMVLCHGGPGLWDYLAPIAAMTDDVATTHRWDQRGGGRSSVVPPYTVDRFVEDIDAVREHFGHEKWIVGGHSWGAMLALAYALRYPERTRALVYICGTGIGTAWRREYGDERERRLRAAGDFDRWQDLHSRTRTADEERELCILTFATDYADPVFGREDALKMLAPGFLPNYEVNAALPRSLGDEATMIERCRILSMPALIIHGAQDPRPPSAVASLTAALPNARVDIIEDAGHLPWTEQAAQFAQILREFIATLDR